MKQTSAVAILLTAAGGGFLWSCASHPPAEPSAAVQTPAQSNSPKPDALKDALTLVKGSIKPAGPWKLPEFATWPMREDLGQCGSANLQPQAFVQKPKADFSEDRHRFPADQPVEAQKAAPNQVRDTGLSFHYDPAAFQRLCGTVTTAPDAPHIRDGNAKIAAWRGKLSVPPASIDPPMPLQSRAVAITWIIIPKPKDAATGFVKLLNVLDENGNVAPKPLRIRVPQAILSQSPACTQTAPIHPPQDTAAAPQDVSIADFYWIQLRQGETFMQAGGCGDFLILANFNFMQKKSAGLEAPWLWASFWWDPASVRFRPSEKLKGPGYNPAAWSNFAMNATYASTVLMFNPGRETPSSNCATCHYARARIPSGTSVGAPGALDPAFPGMSLDFLFPAAKL